MAVCVLSVAALLLGVQAWSQSTPAPAPADPAAAVVAPAAPPLLAHPEESTPTLKKSGAAPLHHPSGRLDWKDLSTAQQDALAPLAWDWEKLEYQRRRKWVEIADRFPDWTPEEQKRRQDRMRELVRLTPEERRVARDTFARVQALPPEKRAELFKKYQELPEEKKAQLAAEAKATKSAVAVKPLTLHRPAVPSKAQIREGSEQKVPGLPRPAKPAPVVPIDDTAGVTAAVAAPPTLPVGAASVMPAGSVNSVPAPGAAVPAIQTPSGAAAAAPIPAPSAPANPNP